MSPHPATAARLLVVDDNPTGRFVITELLRERFPRCVILETDNVGEAIDLLARETVAAVICHRGDDCDDAELVRDLRRMRPTVPIVATSDAPRVAPVISAGANEFARYGAWTTIADAVSRALAPHPRESGLVASAGSEVAGSELTVVVAHNDDAVRSAVRSRIGGQPSAATIVGEAENGVDALQLVRSARPDLAVVDIAMLGQAGIDGLAPLGALACVTHFAYLLVTG